jgi:hypothetical protein
MSQDVKKYFMWARKRTARSLCVFRICKELHFAYDKYFEVQDKMSAYWLLPCVEFCDKAKKRGEIFDLPFDSEQSIKWNWHWWQCVSLV